MISMTEVSCYAGRTGSSDSRRVLLIRALQVFLEDREARSLCVTRTQKKKKEGGDINLKLQLRRTVCRPGPSVGPGDTRT